MNTTVIVIIVCFSKNINNSTFHRVGIGGGKLPKLCHLNHRNFYSCYLFSKLAPAWAK